MTRGVLSGGEVRGIVGELGGIRARSAGGWRPIEPEAPDFHRRNEADPRSYVEGVLHQFNFFPWNSDPLGLFRRLRGVLEVRNLLAGTYSGAHLGPEWGSTVARIVVQHYPRGGGYMNRHRDPVGVHQACVCLLVMSQWGEDYQEGGLVVGSDDPVYPERECAPGDVVWLAPDAVHGIDLIDPSEPLDWSSGRGRWSGLMATNRLTLESGIGDSLDMG